MKFKPESDLTLPKAELERQFRTAHTVGKIRLGEQVLFTPKLTACGYRPYSHIVQAYIRQEEVKAKLCCGVANFDQFYLMLLDQEGRLHKHQILNKDVGKYALEVIAQNNPDAVIGYRQPSTP